jgi:hypothetical protein
MGPKRMHEILRPIALRFELIEPPYDRFDRQSAGLVFLGPVGSALVAAGMRQPKHADHPRQRQALPHQSHHDHGECQEKNQIPAGEGLSAGGCKRNTERGRQ